MAREKLFLVDGSGFIFRAYHALPPLNRPDGTPVNAVLGYANMLVRLLTELKAQHIAVIFDTSGRNFRHDIYPDYKANRPPPPEDLIPQFALIREATRAFNLPSIELAGFEADDLIASYATAASAENYEVAIISSDKDLMQLVNDQIHLLDPIKYKRISTPEVIEKFGVPPAQVVDVQALAGDATDHVPGVPGIGIKTAAQLIQEYGDLENLLRRAAEIKQPKRRESLIEFASQARISKQLVALKADVPLPQPLAELIAKPYEPTILADWLQQQGFRSVLARLHLDRAEGGQRQTPAAANPSSTSAASAAPERHYACIQDSAELQGWIDRAMQQGAIAVDTETTGLTPSQAGLVGISIALGGGDACYIPLQHGASSSGQLDFNADRPVQIPIAQAIAMLKPLLEDQAILKICHNAKFDWQILAQHGINMAPLDDTMLISYALDGGKHSHAMDELAKLHLGITPISYDSLTGTGRNRINFQDVALDKATAYAAEDADITWQLYHQLKPRLAAEAMSSLYYRLDKPMIAVIAKMEQRGILVSRSVLSALSEEFAQRLAALESDIHHQAGENFNVGSPKQLGDILFEKLGLAGSERGKNGAWSTSADILEKLHDAHPIIPMILKWRALAKLKSTYSDALPLQISPRDQRVHTSFALALTNTGRLSSSDPNLQNIPIKSDDGKRIRTAFIAAPDHVLVSADYSQVELRLVAEIAGIERLKEAFRMGADIHRITAGEVFGVPLDAVTPDLRRNAKAINFGIIYGISAFGLGAQLDIPTSEAGRYIKLYLERFPELTRYFEDTKNFARQHGYVETLFGRKCWLPGIAAKNGAQRAFAERQAINARIQGTAADIMKRAMIDLDAALLARGLPQSMLLQVHDELVLEVPKDRAEEIATLTREIMQAAATLSIPLLAEAGWGASWAEAH